MTPASRAARLGRFVETPAAAEVVSAFVPPPLPSAPPVDVLGLVNRLSLAERALGRLDGLATLLPRQDLFLHVDVRKEAVLPSRTEGTQSTLTNPLRLGTEAQAGQPVGDLREASIYVDAMVYGLERPDELPLSLWLIREMHARLLQSGRGGTKSLGEFGDRRTGSAAPAPATRSSCLHRRPSSTPAWASLSPSCTRTALVARADQGRAALRPVRNHPPVPGW